MSQKLQTKKERRREPKIVALFYLSLTEKGESIGRAEREAFGECIEHMKQKLGDDFPQFEQMLRRILED